MSKKKKKIRRSNGSNNKYPAKSTKLHHAEATRITMLIMCHAMAAKYKFGKVRLNEVLAEVSDFMGSTKNNLQWLDELNTWAKEKGIEL